MRKTPHRAISTASAIMECLFVGGIGAVLIRNDWRFFGVCVILVAVAFAVWILLRSQD